MTCEWLEFIRTKDSKVFTSEEIVSIDQYFQRVLQYYDNDMLKLMNKNQIEECQDRLIDVLHFLQNQKNQTYLNLLGAILIRLSFLKNSNRHETPEEFQELIKNYQIKDSLQVKITDLV